MGGDEMVWTLLQDETFHCHCAPAFGDFSTERLKAAVSDALPALRDLSGERWPLRRVRPCQLLEGTPLSGEVSCAYFTVGSQKLRRILVTGIVCNSQEVALVLLAGSHEVNSFLLEHLGAEFGAALQPLRLAPWQLSMATAYGLALVKSDGLPPDSTLELKLECGVTLGFGASVIAELPTTEQVAEVAGRQMLQAVYKITTSRVLGLPYEQLQLQGLVLSRAFSLNHQGTLKLHTETAVPSILHMLMSMSEELVLGAAAPELEEASGLSRDESAS